MNRDVPNLPELLEDKVGGATRYACGYWAMHIRASPAAKDYAIQLTSSTIEFFENNVFPWIEVMSLENRLESVIHSIYNLLDWLGTVCELYCSEFQKLTTHPLKIGQPLLCLRPAQPSTRHPPIRDAFLPPHPAICVTHISFRFTPLTKIIEVSLHDPEWGNKNHRVPGGI